MSDVQAVRAWPGNGALIADVAALGYIVGDVLDPTYGHGRFWTHYRPQKLTATDLNPAKGLGKRSTVDFTDMHWRDDRFNTVVFDPPYRLNGTPDQDYDEAYGIDKVTRWQDRHALIRAGIGECVRVLKGVPRFNARRDLGGYLLVKCQAQVCSGRVRWQDREFAAHAESLGCQLVDRFDLMSETARKQPEGRRQVHARRNHSTLLVLRKIA